MTDIMRDAAHHTELQEDMEEMEKLGISRVPVYWFHFKKFRYTNLKDAIAEAKRDEAGGPKRTPYSQLGPATEPWKIGAS